MNRNFFFYLPALNNNHEIVRNAIGKLQDKLSENNVDRDWELSRGQGDVPSSIQSSVLLNILKLRKLIRGKVISLTRSGHSNESTWGARGVNNSNPSQDYTLA